MNKAIIAGGRAVVALVVLALAAGYPVRGQDVDPAAAASTSITLPRTAGAEADPSFLYGRVTTISNDTFEGRLRWGGDEEAFWGNYFNGFKDKNPTDGTTWMACWRTDQTGDALYENVDGSEKLPFGRRRGEPRLYRQTFVYGAGLSVAHEKRAWHRADPPGD